MGKTRKTEEEKLDQLLTPASVTLGLELPGWADTQDSEAPEYLLGERIRSIREKLGLTHDGLSELTKVVDKAGRGISRTTIRGYELRTYKPGARELRILSLALKVSPSFLIFGEDQDAPAADQAAASGKPKPKVRWAQVSFPLLCYTQLGDAEKQQVAGIIETMYRLQIGEVKFRSMKAFIEDFADTVQDAFSDLMERNDVSTEAIRKVLLDAVAEMRKRHGDEEANLLQAVLPLIESWNSGAG